MEHPSTSRSLTNPKFDAWCAMKVTAQRLIDGSRADEVFKTRLRDLDFRFIPFLSWGEEDVIHLRVVDTRTNTEMKLQARLSHSDIASVPSRVILMSGKNNRTGFNPEPHHVILKYRPHGSKRWRRPKDIHEAQVAYYLMKYR